MIPWWGGKTLHNPSGPEYSQPFLTIGSYLSKICNRLMIFSRGKGLLEGNTVTHRKNRNNITYHTSGKTWWLEDCFPFGMLVFKGLSSISEAPDSEALTSCALTMNGHIESSPIKVSCHFSPTGNLPFPSTPKYLIGIQRCGAWQHNKLTASQKTIMVGQLDLFYPQYPEVASKQIMVVVIPKSLRRLELRPVASWKKTLKFISQANWGSPKTAWAYCKFGSMEVKVGLGISWHFCFGWPVLVMQGMVIGTLLFSRLSSSVIWCASY